MARPKSKTKKILFAVEIIVLLLFIGGLYVYGQLNSKLDKINQPVLDDSKIKVNQHMLCLVLTTVIKILHSAVRTVIQLLLQA